MNRESNVDALRRQRRRPTVSFVIRDPPLLNPRDRYNTFNLDVYLGRQCCDSTSVTVFSLSFRDEAPMKKRQTTGRITSLFSSE